MQSKSDTPVRAALCILLATAVVAMAAGCWKPKPLPPPETSEAPSRGSAESKISPAEPPTPAPGSSEPAIAASRHYRLWQAGEVSDALPAFLAYLQTQAQTDSAERPYFFIILLDETGMALAEWGAMVKQAELVVASMAHGEAVMVIGIDNNSRDREDVRLPVKTLSQQTALAPGEKLQIREEVRALKQREVKAGTDILGALRQAAHYARGKESTHRVALIGFTDLEPQDASGAIRVPTDPSSIARDAQTVGSYPPGTEGGFFYVSTPRYDVIREYWVTIFSRTGLNADPLPAE